MKKIAVGGIVHETNVFSDMPAALSNFKECAYFTGDSLTREYEGGNSTIGGVLRALAQSGHATAPLLYAAATPCGTVSAQAFYALLQELTDLLRAEMPVDGLILVLHGAMSADGARDCEGAILREARKIVGAGVPIVAVLDFHANVSDEMVSQCDALIGYDKNPHTDCHEKGLEAVGVIEKLLYTQDRPARSLVKLPLLLSPINNWTSANPFAQLPPAISHWRGDASILCLSAFGGYIYADSPQTGVSVTTYGWDQSAADECARQVAAMIWESRASALYHGLAVDDAVGYALFLNARPVLLADLGDNVGGGAAGDGTHILSRVLELGCRGFVTTICDPQAARRESGVFCGAVGGKSKWAGSPAMLRGDITFRTDGIFSMGENNHFSSVTGRMADMGRSILVDADGNKVLITSKPVPIGGPEIFLHAGVDLAECNIIAVKGAAAFRAGFGRITGVTLDVNTEGVTTCDISRLPYACEAIKGFYPLNMGAVMKI